MICDNYLQRIMQNKKIKLYYLNFIYVVPHILVIQNSVNESKLLDVT